MTRFDRRALFATGSAAALLTAAGVSAAPRPHRGGHVRAALSPGRLDAVMRLAVFDTLTELGADNTLRASLAARWSADKSATQWRLELRRDVRFHDGNALTARDVVASLRAHFDTQVIRSLKTDDDGRILLSLSAPDAGFPLRLADPRLTIHRADDLADGAPVMNGTGLYRLQRYRPGHSFLGHRRARHFKDGELGWFDRVELIGLNADAARNDALGRGCVDVVDLSDAGGLENRADIVIDTLRGHTCGAIGTGIARPARLGKTGPLDDLRFFERWWQDADRGTG